MLECMVLHLFLFCSRGASQILWRALEELLGSSGKLLKPPLFWEPTPGNLWEVLKKKLAP